MTKKKPAKRLVDRHPGGAQSRVLVHIPIVHNQADMGSWGEEVQRAYIQQKGTEAWQESRIAIAEFWKTLEWTILSLDLDFSRVRIYQDGLPVCGRETDIIRDLAKTGGPNYSILFELMERGAALEGTESLELLLREYDLLKSGKGKTDKSVSQGSEIKQHAMATELIQARDRFIANRIDATLKTGEVGMLFVGALHDIAAFLPKTIEVLSLDEFRSSLSQH